MSVFQKICELLTKHKWRKADGFDDYYEPTEYYWKCKICGKTFWNYKSNGEDIK